MIKIISVITMVSKQSLLFVSSTVLLMLVLVLSGSNRSLSSKSSTSRQQNNGIKVSLLFKSCIFYSNNVVLFSLKFLIKKMFVGQVNQPKGWQTGSIRHYLKCEDFNDYKLNDDEDFFLNFEPWTCQTIAQMKKICMRTSALLLLPLLNCKGNGRVFLLYNN